jgi:hypothetical protein
MYDSAEVETGRKGLSHDQSREFVRIVVEAWEYAAQVANGKMFRQNFANHGAKVGG